MSKENKSQFNGVLKSWEEVSQASKNLNSLGLPSHPDTVKSWDTWKIINFIRKNGNNESTILDVGCNGSPVLPYLRQLEFKNLYGCDVDLKIRKRRLLRRIKNKAFGENPDKLLNEMLENNDGFYNLSVQNLEKTNYGSNKFDFISALSVIEHGVDLKKYFLEMSRILKHNGFLLTSTDYWVEKISTNSNVYDRPGGDVIFEKKEIENMIKLANNFSFELVEPINFQYEDKVVKWKKTKQEYTFIFFCLQKNS